MPLFPTQHHEWPADNVTDRRVDRCQQVARARIAGITVTVRLSLHDNVWAYDADVQDGESRLAWLRGHVALEEE